MTRLEVEPCAVWLQERLGAFVFAVDHPGLPQCAGAHRPGQPCDGTRGKHPCGRWSRDSTASPEVIRAALSRGLRNLGIDCGKSGLLVVDEDRPGAFDSYAASAGHVVPVTFTVTTGKGRHVYFRQPPGVPLGNGTGALAGRDMDVRGNGGFVVGPGSVHHSGVRYTPVDATAPVVAAPDWLAGALLTPPAGALGHPGLRPHGSPDARLRGLVATVLDGHGRGAEQPAALGVLPGSGDDRRRAARPGRRHRCPGPGRGDGRACPRRSAGHHRQRAAPRSHVTGATAARALPRTSRNARLSLLAARPWRGC